MTDASQSATLAYYAAHGCALFPIPAGSKNPTGIVASFARDCTTNAAQWERWSSENPGCNWGVVAGPSRLLIVDIDVSEIGRDRAWQIWADWCAAAGLAPIAPHVQSARGGWHVYFRMPDGSEPGDFQQSALVGRDAAGTRKPVIDMRVGNGFTVAAGSHYDGTAKGEESGTYVAMNDAPPYAAPQALLDACRRNVRTSSGPRPGDRDRDDVAALITWLTERDEFADYETWLSLGMALKLEFGDDGLELWRLSHDDTVTAEIETAKWRSFSDDPTAESVTLSSFLDRANRLGWRGQVRRSVAAMFGEAGQVAAIAAAAGAEMPGPVGAVPMLAGQEMLADLGRPILDTFMSATGDAGSLPTVVDYPTLPDACSGHGLYGPLQDAIGRVMALAEHNTWSAVQVIDPLAVLSLVHQDTADALVRRLRGAGRNVAEGKIKMAAAALAEQVERAFIPAGDWIYSPRGEIEHDNSDNVSVFLGIVGVEIRWNTWLERAEIVGGTDPEIRWDTWSRIDDTIVAKLRMRASRTKTRFRPSKDFLWDALIALAQLNPVDPAIEWLNRCATAWDGKPRLATWLSFACGVPCEPYHQAVGRNIIGGIVRRVRAPGVKHDTMAVLFGPQGTGKSTLCQILAGRDDWFTDTVMLGDAAKELVLSLAGRTVVEIGEMGMRGAANPAHVKAMISRQVDSGRTAYARTVTERARRNIFIGTTNDDEPLVDPTGNRRFLPVRIDREIDLRWLQANVDQLIGEAATLDAAGESFDLPRNVWGAAAAHQDAARAESDVETRLSDWFAETALTGPLTWITAADLAELAGMIGRGGYLATRGAVMKQLGFRKESVRVAGKKTKIWVRGASGSPADIPRTGNRYQVGADGTGRPRVTLTGPSAVGPL